MSLLVQSREAAQVGSHGVEFLQILSIRKLEGISTVIVYYLSLLSQTADAAGREQMDTEGEGDNTPPRKFWKFRKIVGLELVERTQE